MTFTLGSQRLSTALEWGLAAPVQVVRYVLTLDVGPFLVDLELSFLSPEFFPGLVFTEFHSLAFDPLGLLGVALPLILDLDLGCLP